MPICLHKTAAMRGPLTSEGTVYALDNRSMLVLRPRRRDHPGPAHGVPNIAWRDRKEVAQVDGRESVAVLDARLLPAR